MGNINEKNSQNSIKKEIDKDRLGLEGYFDPWTDNGEARAIESVSSPGLGPPYPPSSESTSRQQYIPRLLSDGILAQTSASPTTKCEEIIPTEPIKCRGNPLDIAEAESYFGSNDESFLLSDSNIPDTFGPMETPETNTSTPYIPDEISIPIASGLRSLGTIEELDEEDPITNIDENPAEDDLPSLDMPMLHDSAASRPYAISHLLASQDCEIAITDQALEGSPFPLSSNNAGITLRQSIDIPVAPGCSSFLPPVLELAPLAVLSPLPLDPPTLTVEDIAAITSTDAIPSEDDNLLEDFNDSTPRPLVAPLVVPPDLRIHRSTVMNLCPTPSAPYLDTIPLPPFPAEEDAELFVSEPFATSGLGLIVSKNPVASGEPAAVPKSPGDIPFAQAMVEVEEGLATAPGLMRQGVPWVDVGQSTITPDLTHTSTILPQIYPYVGTQTKTVGIEVDLITSVIGTLEITNDTPTLSTPITLHSPNTLDPSQEAETITLNFDSEKLTPVISETKVVDVNTTNIAKQDPEPARKVFQTPNFSEHLPSSIDRFIREIKDREGPEHTPGRPNWAKAPVEEMITAGSKSSGNALNSKIHTPNTPNWAIAPALKHIALSKIRRGKQERHRNCTRRGETDRLNSKVENSHLILAPSLQKAPKKSVVQKSTKEKFQTERQPMPQFPFAPTEERKVAASRQKVCKWIHDSASVMVSPICDAEREAVTTASCSAFLMDSVSERMINVGVNEGAKSRKEPLSPASRMAKALVPPKVSMRGFHNDEFLEDGVRSKTWTSDSAPIISIDEHMDGSSLFQDDRNTIVYQGKKSTGKNPSPVGRQRSASTTSSLASGISTRSGFSSSSRLFRRAIQQIGSPACSRSASVNHTRTRQIPAKGEAKEPHETANAATQSPEPPSRQSPELGTTPITTTAVTFPEISVTLESTEKSVPPLKRKVKASAPLHQNAEIVNDAGSNNERFMFSFKPPQASIDCEAQKGSRDAIIPDTIKLASAIVPTLRYEEDVIKTQRATSMRTFIPRGKYVPPPIREGPMQRQAQAPPTPLATIALSDATTTSQAQKAPHSAQCPGAPAPPAVTQGSNAHAQPIYLSDDTSMKTRYTASRSIHAESIMSDVKDNNWFGTGENPSSIIQKESEISIRPKPSNQCGPENTNIDPVDPGSVVGKLGIACPKLDPCAPYYPKGLNIYDRQRRVVQVLQVSEDQLSSQFSQRNVGDYLTQSALTQGKVQQDLVNSTDTVSTYGELESFNPTVTANQFQSLNLRTYESRVNFGPTMTFDEPLGFLRSPAFVQGSKPTLIPRPSLPPRLQNQTGVPPTPHGLFEEYSRRQRQETRRKS